MKESRKYGVFLSSFISVFFALPAFAQYAGDAFRYSEINQTGTARFQGLGGNHAALGGDASTISGNPAGLGFYNRSEFSISPAVTNVNTDSRYIDRSTTVGKTNFNIPNASLVISSKPGFQRKWKRTSLGISYSRQQSFRNSFAYSGVNNRSAYVDKVVEDANTANLTERGYDDAYDANGGQFYYPDEAYFRLKMIYPTKFISTTEGSGAPYTRDDKNSPTTQRGQFDSKGANSQWSVTFAGNYDDKLYIGGSVGLTRLRYSYTNSLFDNFDKPTVFRSSIKGEDLTVTGNGINATFGIIYKASPFIQFGGSLTSPTFTGIKETFNENVQIDYIRGSLTNDNGVDIGPTESGASIVPNDFEYSLISPLRGSAGLTYFFGTKGFLTGSLEYVGYRGMRTRTKFNTAQSQNDDFNQNNKAEIQDTYKDVVNLRIGGELRAGLFRGRLGLAYLADPYRIKTDGVDRSKLLLSAGAGVRNTRFFADIAGTLSTFKSAYTPYVLSSVQDYSSVEISNRGINVMLTIGTFF